MTLIDRHEKPRAPRPPRSGPKPTLPMAQLPIFRVQMGDLEDYLYEVYRMGGFDFLLAAGLTQGECPEYIVQAALPASITCVRQAADIRQGRRTKNVALLLNVLCIDGFIPAGKYIIDTHVRPMPIDVYTSLVKARLAAYDLDCLQDPQIVAFKEANRNNKTFMSQAVEVDAIAAEVVANERELLQK